MKIICPICDGHGGLPRGGPLDDKPCPACERTGEIDERDAGLSIEDWQFNRAMDKHGERAGVI